MLSGCSRRRKIEDEGADDDRSAIQTDVPGRIDKASAIAALQASGQSYDRVRETLKDVSVDASGKVELEDWVEVRCCRFCYVLMCADEPLPSSMRNSRRRQHPLCCPREPARLQ